MDSTGDGANQIESEFNNDISDLKNNINLLENEILVLKNEIKLKYYKIKEQKTILYNKCEHNFSRICTMGGCYPEYEYICSKCKLPKDYLY